MLAQSDSPPGSGIRRDAGGETAQAVLVALAPGPERCLAALGAGTAVVGTGRLTVADN
ncbi:hypothetical protein ACWCQP_46770 [Streptomyces chartreusis]